MSEKFGSPPREWAEWIGEFILDTDQAAKRCLNPFRRIWYRGRINGLQDAITLRQQELRAQLAAIEGRPNWPEPGSDKVRKG